MSTVYVNPYRFGYAYKNAVLADNPIRYWRFGEASGSTAVDETGNSNGTYVGLPTLGQSGIVTSNDAALFSGVGQYVDTDTLGSWGSGLYTGDWSVEGWIKFTSTGYESLCGAYSGSTPGFQIQLNRSSSSNPDAGHIRGFFRNNGGNGAFSVDAGSTLYDDDWHHIVFTHGANDNAPAIYFDGSSMSVSSSGSLANGTYGNLAFDLYWMANNFNGSAAVLCPGTLDEAAIYDTELSAARVLAHYNAANNI